MNYSQEQQELMRPEEYAHFLAYGFVEYSLDEIDAAVAALEEEPLTWKL